MRTKKQYLLFFSFYFMVFGLSFCCRAEAETLIQQIEQRTLDTGYQIDFKQHIQTTDQAMDIYEQQQRNKELIREQMQKVKEQSQQSKSLMQDLREKILRANLMAKLDQLKIKLLLGLKLREDMGNKTRETRARMEQLREQVRDLNMNIKSAQQIAQENRTRTRMMMDARAALQLRR